MARTPPAESFLPLPSATLEILLSLADEERHGYAIMKEVAERSGGAVRIGAGTLYGTLKRLLASALVEETERADPGSSDERRRYYRITPRGLDVARAESRRLARVVLDAQRKKLIGAKLA